MADLIRTVDPDEEGEASEEDAPVLAIGRGTRGRGGKKTKVDGGDMDANFFRGLVSDDEDGGRGGWDFNAVPASAEVKGQNTTGLRSKIDERLQQKREDAGEIEEEDGEGNKSSSSSTAAKKAATKDKASKPGTAEHLKTDVHFADLRLSRPLLRAVTDLGFETPTPIQRDVIPPALQGLDILATAETGSGKTASFLLPALERLCQSSSVRSRKRDANGRVLVGHVATKALVLIPTRELAAQCYAMLKDLAKHTLATYQLVAGGFDSNDQASSLRHQPDMVVATPGRMLDHLLNSQSVHMELLEIVIFDEADRLLELGFRDECMQVLQRCSKGRQTMLFSATMNTSVEDLAALALVRPVRIHASPVNRVAETLEQEFVKAPSDALREAVLLSLCQRNYTSQVIVFCATRQAAHRLAILFGLCGMSFAEIHGNLAQWERVEALQKFQDGEANFLIATDLAARGLDLCNVSTVINFHLPLDISRYIHRVGRTARMGAAGRAVTVYTTEEYAKVKKLGRQCCSKVKSKVLKRTVAADAVRSWQEKIAGLEEDIKAIGEEESLERELRLADILANKSENMQKYKADIQSRPAKQWIMTNNDKKKLRDADRERIEKVAEEQAAPDPEPQTKGKKRKEKDNESPHAKRERKTRERLKEQRKKEVAERLASQNRVRASARRVRKAAKPGGAPPQNATKQGKKKKKGGR